MKNNNLILTAIKTQPQMPVITNPELELALDFVEKTNRNIYLTGKAGTGKTTFLHKIKTESMKRLVVVAPTGVAAINAKGVTIHSFFQMPFGPILPEGDPRRANNQFQRKFNRQKINIIRSLDLLIIDEISMVRADLLDGIDQVLRRYKDRDKVFGGVQVLMIGDLQQLSPVVKPHEWNLLKDHYANAFFFSAKSFQQSNAIGIELKHIYRQEDEKFIAILNEIRNNQLSPASAEVINSRYQPDFVPKEEDGYITLTTHNARANTINDTELQKLKPNAFNYKAIIDGNFKEHAYPNHEILTLKEGAQVMFIKNDSSPDKLYYNGKIGKIISLTNKGVTVQCPNDQGPIYVEKETWENTSYTLDKNTQKITSDIVGSFTQIPLRLAWAITIHKSQGLTFEKAIIDAEASFAHGQTYVALSRCKSLEGIVLRTPIRDSSIISDSQVNAFTKVIEENQPDDKALHQSQMAYQLSMIEDLFQFYTMTYPIKRIFDIYYKNKSAINGNILDAITHIKEKGVLPLLKISNTFKQQVNQLAANTEDVDLDNPLQERLQKAIAYFLQFSKTNLLEPIENLNYATDNKQIKKELNLHLDRLSQMIHVKIYCLEGLQEKFSVAKYLELRAKAVLQKTDKPSRQKAKQREAITSTEHKDLFAQLRELRTDLAEENEVEVYQIFPQRALFEMCEFFPNTPKLLKKINGLGKVRVENYGEEIIEIIQKYIDEKKLTPKEYVKEVKKEKKSPTKQISYEMFKSGKSIVEIAKERELVPSTIESHLSHYVGTGDLPITDLMSKEKYEELKKIMKKTKYESFTDLKHKIDNKFSYNDLRLVALKLDSEKTNK